jgi:hypothetical protein
MLQRWASIAIRPRFKAARAQERRRSRVIGLNPKMPSATNSQ